MADADQDLPSEDAGGGAQANTTSPPAEGEVRALGFEEVRRAFLATQASMDDARNVIRRLASVAEDQEKARESMAEAVRHTAETAQQAAEVVSLLGEVERSSASLTDHLQSVLETNEVRQVAVAVGRLVERVEDLSRQVNESADNGERLAKKVASVDGRLDRIENALAALPDRMSKLDHLQKAIDALGAEVQAERDLAAERDQAARERHEEAATRRRGLFG